jgi:hypothetical protein
MPESVKDRCTKAHEYVFLLSKSPRYYFDAEAIAEPVAQATIERLGQVTLSKQAGSTRVPGKTNGNMKAVPPRFGGSKYGDNAAEEHRTKSGNTYDCTDGKRNKRSVWTVATQPYKEAHFACVDAETEALTPSGWKRHNELTDGDLIAAYLPDADMLTWQSATFHRYPFDGELVAIEKRDSSQRLTPNHRCLVKRRSGETDVVLAEDLNPSMSIPTAVPLRVNEAEGPGEAFAALLGWYVTEGEKKRHNVVRINQSASANPEKVESIRALLEKVGATFTEMRRTRDWRGRESTEVVFSINGTVAKRLHEASPDKGIPWEWVNWPIGDVESFMNAVIDGDGHRREDGRCCVVQKDRGFVDVLQAMALRLGWRGHITPRSNGGFALYLTKNRWLTLRRTNGAYQGAIGREHYSGIVWCPSVPSTFWIARRSGRTFITGNTFPPKLISPMILAGCPVGGTVLDPFGGSGTTGEVAERYGRNSILIELNPAYIELQKQRTAQMGLGL